MPRRPNIERPEQLEISLPESEKARLALLLWSEAEGRVPYGAYSKFFLSLLREYFAKMETQSVQSGNATEG